MLGIYRKLYDILDARERWLTLLVFVLLVTVALVETAGVASIMPFMAVLANPEVVEANRYLAAIYRGLAFESTEAFLFFLGIGFLILIMGSLALRAFAFWAIVRFSNARNYAWSCRLLQGYLYQPYEWFLSHHSGTLGASVLNEVNRAVHGVLFPALQLISHGLVATFLLGLMISVDYWLALSITLVLGTAYTGLFMMVRRYLRRIGEERRNANDQRFKVAQEAFGGIKDVKVAGLEEAFVERFRAPSLRMIRREATVELVSQLPAFLMEALVFGGIMIVLLYFLGSRGGLQEALPIFSLYALAGYRLMPALQTLYRQFSQLRFHVVVLDAMHRDLYLMPLDSATPVASKDGPGKLKPLGLRETLQLINVSYRYPSAGRRALTRINLKIPANTMVGLVGPTGSGKTTLVDLILGLLQPEDGKLIVDGQPITPSLHRAWQLSIGYVPQQIYLSDDTVSGNIAFGVPPDRIDQDAVERAARVANLHDFVVGELPNGYNTLVGERGVRLSGGQRQRIGIARALYRDPVLLIFDEATSALDNLTEQVVMEAVHNLGNQKTIILIAHRLSTVRQCDRIFYLEQGQVIAAGTYNELLANSLEFSRLAGHGN